MITRFGTWLQSLVDTVQSDNIFLHFWNIYHNTWHSANHSYCVLWKQVLLLHRTGGRSNCHLIFPSNFILHYLPCVVSFILLNVPSFFSFFVFVFMYIVDFWVEEISSSHELSPVLHHTNRSPGHTYRWASKSTSIADIVNIFFY